MTVRSIGTVLASAGIIASFVCIPEAFCADKQKRLLFLSGRSPTDMISAANGGAAAQGQIDLAGSFGSMVSNGSSRPSLFTEYYMDGVRKLQMEAQPDNNPNNFDDDKASQAGQRALTVRVGQAVNETLNRSELRDSYRHVLKTYQKARDAVRVSVQKNEEGYIVGNKQRGAKILEFNVEPSNKTLLTPNINVGSTGRIHYDPTRDAVMFEFRRDW